MNYDLGFLITSRLTVILAFVFIAHLFARRGRIDICVLLYVLQAVLTVTVGCRLCHVWLIMNAGYYVERDDFWDIMRLILTNRAYILILILFGALTAHFMIYALGRVFVLARSRALTRSTALHFASASSAMLCIVLASYFLCYGVYGKQMIARVEWERQTEMVTEQYLLEWLREEPESPHAKQLYEAFLEEKSNKRVNHIVGDPPKSHFNVGRRIE